MCWDKAEQMLSSEAVLHQLMINLSKYNENNSCLIMAALGKCH